jgi:hypothetical protein
MGKPHRIGKAGEELGLIQIALQEGITAKIARTGRGHDFKSERYDPYSGECEETFYEIKVGDTPLTKLQRQTKEDLGNQYRVHRVDLPFDHDLY